MSKEEFRSYMRTKPDLTTASADYWRGVYDAETEIMAMLGIPIATEGDELDEPRSLTLESEFGKALVTLAVAAEAREYEARLTPEKIGTEQFWEDVRARVEGFVASRSRAATKNVDT